MPPTSSPASTSSKDEHHFSETTEKVIEELLEDSKEKAETIIISATPEGKPVVQRTKNLYPSIRHTLLVTIVIFCIVVIIYLMIQNGRSIYEHGI